MALIECEECKASVSDKAPSCIHCGAPIISATQALEGAKLKEWPYGNADGTKRPPDNWEEKRDGIRKLPTELEGTQKQAPQRSEQNYPVKSDEDSNSDSSEKVVRSSECTKPSNEVSILSHGEKRTVKDTGKKEIIIASTLMVLFAVVVYLASAAFESVDNQAAAVARSEQARLAEEVKQKAYKREESRPSTTYYTTKKPIPIFDAPNGNRIDIEVKYDSVYVYEKKDGWIRISGIEWLLNSDGEYKERKRPQWWVLEEFTSKTKPTFNKNRSKPKSENGYPIYSNSMDYQKICSFSQMESYLANLNNSAACEHVLNQTGGIGGGTKYFDKVIMRAYNSGR